METKIRIKSNDLRYDRPVYQGFMSWDEMTVFRDNYCRDCNNKKSCQTSLKVDSAISLQREYWNPNCLVTLRLIKPERGLPKKVITCSDFKPLNS